MYSPSAKIMFKKLIQRKLEKHVKSYFKAHPEVRLVVVVGSVGKTSTKTILSNVLGDSYRVRMHSGNHNTDISAPLAMLGVDYPTSLKSPSAWMKVFKDIKNRINSPADVDVIIQELGVDQPGDMQQFVGYLEPTLSIVTAITPEHMLNFASLDEVAKEELLISQVSKTTLINIDDTSEEFLKHVSDKTQILTYGVDSPASYKFNQESFSVEQGFSGSIAAHDGNSATINIKAVGRHSILPVLGATAAGHVLGVDLTAAAIKAGVVPAVSGRMNLLRGIKQSMIIDDSYNSSPAALRSALETLFELQGSQRMAIIGSMNELGSISKEEHEAIGRMCTPDKLDILITVGEEANKYIALAAQQNGCVVHQAWHSKEAGEKAKELINPGAIVLAKGSEGGIFIEEAVKYLLEDEGDIGKLVRQTDAWLERKQKFFNK